MEADSSTVWVCDGATVGFFYIECGRSDMVETRGSRSPTQTSDIDLRRDAQSGEDVTQRTAQPVQLTTTSCDMRHTLLFFFQHSARLVTSRD